MILIHTIVPGVIRYRLWYTEYMVAVVLIGTRGWLLSSITRVPGGYTRSDPTRSKGRVRPQYPRVLDPAGNDATGTRVPARFEDPGSIFFHNISRKLIQMSNRVVPEAIVDLDFLVSKGRVRPQYRRVLDPAGNDATGTRVLARFEDPRFNILPQYH